MKGAVPGAAENSRRGELSKLPGEELWSSRRTSEKVEGSLRAKGKKY